MADAGSLAKWYTPCPEPYSDHIYKTAHGVDVGLRVWPAEVEDDAPWLFWIHGGGWAGGYHHRMVGWSYPAFHAKGYHIVSVGYRFSPHVGIQDQIADLQDAFAWCRRSLPSMIKIDLDQYVVAGESAGGYFTLISPYILSPPPKALIDIYGPAKLVDERWAQRIKDAEGRPQEKIEYLVPDRTDADCEAYWSERDPSRAQTFAPFWGELAVPEDTLRQYLALPDYTHQDIHSLIMDTYKYVMVTTRSTPTERSRIKTWLRGEDYDSEEAYRNFAESMSPFFKLDETDTHPPTFILHGTADAAVPVEQSYELEEKLKAKGVPVGSRYQEGGEHSFESRIMGPDEPGWKEFVEPAMDFVEKYIRA